MCVIRSIAQRQKKPHKLQTHGSFNFFRLLFSHDFLVICTEYHPIIISMPLRISKMIWVTTVLSILLTHPNKTIQ